MRLKDYAERDGKRVWLSEKEIQSLLDAIPQGPGSDNTRERAAVLLAARCGLRRQEIVDVTPAHLVSNDTGRIVRVWEGKGDQYREVPCPDALVDVAFSMGNAPDEPLVDVDPSTIYDWVQKYAQQRRAESGDEGWQYVGPHDLRRSWGVRTLESGVLPAVVMEWGGWDDWATFRNHYLAEFSPEVIRRERGKVSWLGGQPDAEGGKTSYAAISTSRPNY